MGAVGGHHEIKNQGVLNFFLHYQAQDSSPTFPSAYRDMSDKVSGGEEKGQSSTEGNIKENDEQDEAQTIGKPEKENSIEDVCDNMLEKGIDYMHGELTGTVSYRILHPNCRSQCKYSKNPCKNLTILHVSLIMFLLYID